MHFLKKNSVKGALTLEIYLLHGTIMLVILLDEEMTGTPQPIQSRLIETVQYMMREPASLSRGAPHHSHLSTSSTPTCAH
jgi:hypothetical protein